MKRIKKDFIRSLTDIGLPETDADKIMDLFIDNIAENLRNRNEIHLLNFGKFKIVKKKKTTFINPKTKNISSIKGINRVKFIPSRNLIKYINYVKD